MTQLRGRFDYGFDLPQPNASLWLRTAAGATEGDRDNPLAFFYLGGLVEYDTTTTIFTNPTQKRTEDYITGRFG